VQATGERGEEANNIMDESKTTDQIIDKRQGNNMTWKTTRTENHARKRGRSVNRIRSNKRRREKSSDLNSSDYATTARPITLCFSSSDISSSEDETKTDERDLPDLDDVGPPYEEILRKYISKRNIRERSQGMGGKQKHDREERLRLEKKKKEMLADEKNGREEEKRRRQQAKEKEERRKKKNEEKQKTEIVTLNVGGKKFTTLKITVNRIIDKIVQSDKKLLFIDRDSKLFLYILNYLRYQQQGETNPSRDLLPSDRRSLAALQLEAKYFNLSKLKEQCKDKRRSV
jgi:hypothetical protein